MKVLSIKKEKCYELANNQMVWAHFGEKPDWVDLKASVVICGPFCPVRWGCKGNRQFGYLYSTNTIPPKYRYTYHFPALFYQAVGEQDVNLLPRPVHVFVAVDSGPYALHRLASTLPNPAIYLQHSVHTTANLACYNKNIIVHRGFKIELFSSRIGMVWIGIWSVLLLHVFDWLPLITMKSWKILNIPYLFYITFLCFIFS